MILSQNENCLTKLVFIAATLFLISCGSTSKAICLIETKQTQARYYVTDSPNYRKGEGKFYACVDSSNVRIMYSFQPDNIYKTYKNDHNYIYTLVSDKKPELQLTLLDSLVLSKADNLMDSIGYKNLKRAKGATGFVVEVAGH